MVAFQKDKLWVEVHNTRAEMGRAAACAIEEKIVELLGRWDEVNVIFAAAPSQNETLQALAASKKIAWDRVNAFHMDEYIGLPPFAPQTFGNFLRASIFSRVPFRSVSYIDAAAEEPELEALRYEKLLNERQIDVVVMGIGENGHVAFNDPPVADFLDKRMVKTVQLDEVCRQQQVNDGCFSSIDEVPKYAITLTVPALMSAKWVFCVVPAASKSAAVKNTLFSEISERCPATILRTKENAKLYLDADSAALIKAYV